MTPLSTKSVDNSSDGHLHRVASAHLAGDHLPPDLTAYFGKLEGSGRGQDDRVL